MHPSSIMEQQDSEHSTTVQLNVCIVQEMNFARRKAEERSWGQTMVVEWVGGKITTPIRQIKDERVLLSWKRFRKTTQNDCDYPKFLEGVKYGVLCCGDDSHILARDQKSSEKEIGEKQSKYLVYFDVARKMASVSVAILTYLLDLDK